MYDKYIWTTQPTQMYIIRYQKWKQRWKSSVFFLDASPFFSAWWTRREVSVYPITRVINALKKEVFHVILKSKRFANDYNIFFNLILNSQYFRKDKMCLSCCTVVNLYRRGIRCIFYVFVHVILTLFLRWSSDNRKWLHLKYFLKFS